MVDLSRYRANVSFNSVRVGEEFDADPSEMAPLVERGVVSPLDADPPKRRARRKATAEHADAEPDTQAESEDG